MRDYFPVRDKNKLRLASSDNSTRKAPSFWENIKYDYKKERHWIIYCISQSLTTLKMLVQRLYKNPVCPE